VGNHLGVIGCAAVLFISGCAAAPGPGSLTLIGNEGSVCIPSRDGMLVQLGGVMVKDVTASIVPKGVTFSHKANVTIVGSYLLPMNGTQSLVGFDWVDDGWQATTPSGAIIIGDEQVMLDGGQAYNLVILIEVIDADDPAELSGIELLYNEAGIDHIESVGDEAVVPALGDTCF